MAYCSADQCSQSVFRHKIIAVHKEDVVALSAVHSGIACGTLSAIGLMNDTHLRILCGIAVTNFDGGIGGAIVDEQYFVIFSVDILMQ